METNKRLFIIYLYINRRIFGHFKDSLQRSWCPNLVFKNAQEAKEFMFIFWHTLESNIQYRLFFDVLFLSRVGLG